MADFSQRFMFEQCDIRGELVQLELSYQECLGNHQYPSEVAHILGEFLAASALLGATIKFDGTLVLQARGQGQLPLVMAEYHSSRHLRAIARPTLPLQASGFDALLGGGTLAITIDPSDGQRYQGVVALQGNSLAAAICHYFVQSEQLDTYLVLFADNQRAAGLMLQALPPSQGHQAIPNYQQWQELQQLTATVTAAELLHLAPETLLHRLYHQHPLRLMPPNPLKFRCGCSTSRMGRALLSLGRAEAESILDEQGRIEMTCEFCNRQYHFEPAAVAQLFGDDQPQQVH